MMAKWRRRPLGGSHGGTGDSVGCEPGLLIGYEVVISKEKEEGTGLSKEVCHIEVRRKVPADYCEDCPNASP
jgi:hypothetical protein